MEFARDTVDAGTLMERVAQLLDQGRPGAARPLLAAARGLTQPSAGLSVLAARLALSDGKLDSAEAELDQALRAEPDHPGLRKCRAEVRRRLGDLDGATRDAAEAVILDRGDPAAKALLGELLLQLGRTADAAACLTEAVALLPQDSIFRELLAQALTADNDLDRAMAILLEGIAILPGATAMRNAAILLCIRRRDFVQAERLAEQARIDGAADANTFGLKGHALSSLGRQNDAAFAHQYRTRARSWLRYRSRRPRFVRSRTRPVYRDRSRRHACWIRHASNRFTRRCVEARLPGAALREDTAMWRLILAAELLCYFGALDDMLSAVRDRTRPGGRFIFSVEELLPDHDGTIPGNGDWAPGRLGRYSHAAHYVTSAADAVGFRCLSLDRETVRYEAGGPVAGLLIVLERPRYDA